MLFHIILEQITKYGKTLLLLVFNFVYMLFLYFSTYYGPIYAVSSTIFLNCNKIEKSYFLIILCISRLWGYVGGHNEGGPQSYYGA